MPIPLNLPPKPKRPARRRLAGFAALGVVLFLLLWIAAFSWLTSVVAASAAVAGLFALACTSDALAAAIEGIIEAVLAVFMIFGALFAAIAEMF